MYPQVALGNRHHVDVRPIWVRHDADVEQLGQRRNDHGRLEVHVMLVGIGLAHEIALREQEVFEKIAHKHRPPPQAVVRNAPNHRCGSKAGDSVGLTKRGRLSCEISPTSCPRKDIITRIDLIDDLIGKLFSRFESRTTHEHAPGAQGIPREALPERIAADAAAS